MGSAVCTNESGTIHSEADRQALDRHVMHHLVVGALQEGRVDGAERLHAFGRQPGGEGHRVLFGDADIEAAIGEALAELSSPVPEGIAAVMATIALSLSASSISASANTLV